jgi:energy-coupling factor transport system ATP-binding protein
MVAIGAVLALNSDVLILDEPTAGLDNPSIARLTKLAHDLAAAGKTIIVVSHDLDFCFEALDRVVLVDAGRLALDTDWNAMTTAERAALAADVGLPLALAAVEAVPGVSVETLVA